MRLCSASRLGPCPIRHPACAISNHSHTVGSRTSSASLASCLASRKNSGAALITKAFRAGDPHRGESTGIVGSRCRGHQYVTLHLFCEALSLCPRGHSFYRDDVEMVVFCFAELEHAVKFSLRFGGEFIAPADRPRWPGCR